MSVSHPNHSDAVQQARSQIATGRMLRYAPVQEFAVGGCGNGQCNGGCGGACGLPPLVSQHNAMCKNVLRSFPIEPEAACYRWWGAQNACAETAMIGRAITIAGQAPFLVRAQPVRGAHFLPTRVQMRVNDNVDFEALGEMLVTAVTINGVAQECFDDEAPTAASLGVPTGDFTSRDQRTKVGVPVRWGPIGKIALNEELLISGFNPNIVADVRDITVVVYGYCTSTLPGGWACGKYPGDAVGLPTSAHLTGAPRGTAAA